MTIQVTIKSIYSDIEEVSHDEIMMLMINTKLKLLEITMTKVTVNNFRKKRNWFNKAKMRHENKGCDSEFIHIDPDEADIRDKYAACNTKIIS